MIKAIETRYKGYRFRSRLEARWAVFFDAIGVDWVYEPEGFMLDGLGPYLPDFFFRGNGHRGPYVEIKGERPTRNEIKKLLTLCDEKCAYGLLVWGVPGEGHFIEIHKEGFVERESEDYEFDIFDEAIDRFPISGGVTWDEYKKAADQARAARFEHGERP